MVNGMANFDNPLYGNEARGTQTRGLAATQTNGVAGTQTYANGAVGLPGNHYDVPKKKGTTFC